MPELKEFFESVLMVRTLPGPILLNRYKCLLPHPELV